MHVYIKCIYTLYTLYIHIQGYYLNCLDRYKLFTVKELLIFVISCYLGLLSSIVPWIFF